jgi:putative metal-binding protein
MNYLKTTTVLLTATLSLQPFATFASTSDKERLIAKVKNLEARVQGLESRLYHADLDNDGFSPATGDCNDAEASVNPGASEIPGDGIDNDCNPNTPDNVYSVGDIGPAGGIVFYVYNNGANGMEVSPSNIGPDFGAPWGCMGTEIEGADSVLFGDGKQNTADILNGCNDTDSAAKLVSEYSLNGYSDWFLPSRDEWTAIFSVIDSIGDTSIGIYWTSSETHEYGALNISSYDGRLSIEDKYGNYGVRAAREF